MTFKPNSGFALHRKCPECVPLECVQRSQSVTSEKDEQTPTTSELPAVRPRVERSRFSSENNQHEPQLQTDNSTAQRCLTFGLPAEVW